jgi:hypothetical protein
MLTAVSAHAIASRGTARATSLCDALRLRVPLARLLLRMYHANVMGRAAAKV